MDTASERATRQLTFYLRTMWEAAGLRWDSDNDAEIAGIVSDLVAAAKDAE